MKSMHEFPSEEAYIKYLKVYFAGLAMQGLLSNPEWKKSCDGDLTESTAEKSVDVADKLIQRLGFYQR